MKAMTSLLLGKIGVNKNDERRNNTRPQLEYGKSV